MHVNPIWPKGCIDACKSYMDTRSYILGIFGKSLIVLSLVVVIFGYCVSRYRVIFMSIHNQGVNSGVEQIMLNNWNYLRSAIEEARTNVISKHIRPRRGVEGENLIQN